MSERHACIARHRPQYAVALMCRVLGVSRSGFYAAQRRRPSARARADEQLAVEIRAAHVASHRAYGSPRVHADLRARGVACGRKRVARLMHAAALVGRRRRAESVPPARRTCSVGRAQVLVLPRTGLC